MAVIEAGAPPERGDRRRMPPMLARLLRRRIAVAGAVMLVLITLAAVAAPLLTPYDPSDLVIRDRLQRPHLALPAQHPFGTDDLGRDVWARTLYGARLSLLVGLTTSIFAAFLGTLVALVAGTYRWLDDLLMRIMDGLMALPGTLLAIAIMAAVGPRVSNMIVALSLVYLPRCARVARSSVLVVREQVYVEAAVALGARRTRVMRAHLLPGTLSPVLVQATYVFATAVLLEAALSFLGVGAPADVASWGTMLAEGRLLMRGAPWLTIFPGLVLSLTVLSVNMLGDGLRDALDPRLRPR